METKIKKCIYCDNSTELVELLNNGLDPNFEGGWPIRLAARHGSYSVVKTLIQYGANPHLLSGSGASTLQLAVYSTLHWDSDKWTFLLSFCDSSQLADGAAVAIIFKNIPALITILQTGRCNTNLPTTLTGKTVEALAKGYKLDYLLNGPVVMTQTIRYSTPPSSRVSRQLRPIGLGLLLHLRIYRMKPWQQIVRSGHFKRKIRKNLLRITTENSVGTGSLTPQQHPHRNLSPSVARFFHQTAGQSGLTPPRNTVATSPSSSSRLP